MGNNEETKENIGVCADGLMQLMTEAYKQGPFFSLTPALIASAALTGTLMRHAEKEHQGNQQNQENKGPRLSKKEVSIIVAAMAGVSDRRSDLSFMDAFVQASREILKTSPAIHPLERVDQEHNGSGTLVQDVGALARRAFLLKTPCNLTTDELVYASARTTLRFAKHARSVGQPSTKIYLMTMEALAAGFVQPPVPPLSEEPDPVFHDDEQTKKAADDLQALIAFNNVALVGTGEKHPHAVLGTLGVFLGEEMHNASLKICLRNTPDLFLFSQTVSFFEAVYDSLTTIKGSKPSADFSLDNALETAERNARTPAVPFVTVPQEHRPILNPLYEGAFSRKEARKILDSYQLTGWKRPSACAHAAQKALLSLSPRSIDPEIGFRIAVESACVAIHTVLDLEECENPLAASPQTAFFKKKLSSLAAH